MILDEIVAKKRQSLEVAKKERSLSRLKAELSLAEHAFSKGLQQADWALIAECKLGSPSKGRFCHTHTVTELAALFTGHGATALSIHTDSHFFGQLADLQSVRSITKLPILRKDFIIDPYQIYEARWAGADGVLLIADILSEEQLTEFLQLADELGMDCLVESHSQEVLEKVLKTLAPIIGINNRDLRTFVTDLEHTYRLLPQCGNQRMVISESGIRTGEDARRLQAAGVKGILVGEALTVSGNIEGKTQELALRLG